MSHPPEWRRGVRASVPLVVPTAAIGITFGVLASPVVGPVAALVMSAVVWSGTAQFAALSVVSAGGGAALAGTSGLLANSRFLPMGFAIAPSLDGTVARRAAIGTTLADASFAIAHRGEGRFDIPALVGAAPLQYAAWVGGTALGVVGANVVGDPEQWGLDVLFPAFYLSLLLPELHRDRRAQLTAGLAAALALALTPLTPPGVAIVIAAGAALIGLRK